MGYGNLKPDVSNYRCSAYPCDPLLQLMPWGFLDISHASVKTSSDKLDKATMVTHGFISKDWSKGPFGYGVLTGDSAIVSTTHKGVRQ